MNIKIWGVLTGASLLASVLCTFAQDEMPAAPPRNLTGKIKVADKPALPADRDFNAYLPLLRNKKVGLIVNQTSDVDGTLLPDTLLTKGIKIIRLFSPEHGLRGMADAGEHIANGTDARTGLPVVSLYGKNKKPAPAQLKDIEVMVYDLQDVGVRFYTYISTLQYVMEACAENHIPLVILDRPNPLGFMVDGPVLEKANASFVGMQPVPVAYGMTAGEYAQMLVGEKWLNTGLPLDLTVIKCSAYDHNKLYELKVPPSPNLKTMTAVYLYPSLCFFEGTVVSVGRGTAMPFQMYGNPDFPDTAFPYTFTPRKMAGASEPMYNEQECRGALLAQRPEEALKIIGGKINLTWLLKAYNAYPDKEKFFNDFFVKLAGTDALQTQIKAGATEEEIRKSWVPGLRKFMTVREKYLLYP